jgi:hypothetical protein
VTGFFSRYAAEQRLDNGYHWNQDGKGINDARADIIFIEAVRRLSFLRGRETGRDNVAAGAMRREASPIGNFAIEDTLESEFDGQCVA